MIIKKFCGENLPALGLGTMRLPQLPDGTVDEVATAEMVDYAIENGVNYFDTAWFYHNGESEGIMGRTLTARHSRESFYLASKFPGLDPANLEKKEEIFETQLRRCQVEYFDFYLIHNVSDKTADDYMNPKYGLLEYLLEQKRKGRIKHLGFSTHASNPTMRRFLEYCGEEMEFAQIQLNYLDYRLQAAKEKLEILQARHIPVWIMEPVRGGKLANLDEAHVKKLKALRPDEEPVAFAFRFLQSFTGIGVTLSGMSNMEQLKANIATFSEEKPLNGAEMTAVLEIADDMVRKLVLPCTECHYCEEKCPKKLPIPRLLALCGADDPAAALADIPAENRPDACIACRQCEKVCPQEIKISGALAYMTSKWKG